MTNRRHDADLLVLGYSFEAALTAALASRRKYKVLWIGGAPEASVTVGRHRVPTAPGLLPSLAHAPTLAKVLREVGLLADVQRNQKPTSLQCHGERLRISLPEDWLRTSGGEAALQSLQDLSGVADELSTQPLHLGFFARRRFESRRKVIEARLGRPVGPVGEATSLIDEIFGRGPTSLGGTLQAAAAPTDLPGGTLALGQMLQKKAVEQGARLFPDGPQLSLLELKVRFGGIEGRLSSGETITAKMALDCFDQTQSDRLLPEVSLLRRRHITEVSQPLLRLSFLVQRRGVPQALGPFAILRATRPVWLERRRVDDDIDGLSLFWRSDGTDMAAQTEGVRRLLGEVTPYFDRHLVESAGPSPVIDHHACETMPPLKIARRAIRARGPILGAWGIEGASLAATAFIERVQKLSGKREAVSLR